ncbi:outer membrane beta-barrel protein [Puia dinghuensis]|uniref:Outer membrane protein beta-barrel domain-containing protein n=1 Tax=Puia dinghuensis TaxID=1792502 RepID=A0A8J2UEU1_9BACT|nr:outer membrane beta-barrel protein [Puia dinghuensis]GGB07804.1 hypothetical protein GCM10011511_34180 [Puia dinghuensis]
MKESSFYSDDFEQLIREKTEQYKMYPSEKVWKGVHNSLHTKRRWFIGSMALLVTGILFLAGRELIAPSSHAIALRKAAKGSTADFATKPPLAENIPNAPLTAYHSPAAAVANVRRNAAAGSTILEDQDLAYRGISITLSNPVINPSDLSEWLSRVQLPDRAPDLAVIAARTPATDAGKTPEDVTKPGARTGGETASLRESGDESRESIDETGADGLTAHGVLESLSARGTERARNNVRGRGHLASNKTNGNEVTADGRLSDAGAAKASASAIAEAEDRQRVNWLQDYAMNILPAPSRRGRTYFQFSLAPTINYRVLSGLDPSFEKFGPTPNGFTVQPGDRINHSAAFGFEFGGSILYRLTRNLSVKGGLQFNFARYMITAYNNSQLGTTYSYYGYMMDSMTRSATTQQASSAGGFGPVTQETLKNDYYQLSAPIGFELRVLGNERLQFNLGATVQPSYLLGTSSYMLSSNKTSWDKEPDLYRKWNVNGAVEAFLSYRVGNLRWQIGPEFRYQFFSSYTSQSQFAENLKSYGIKIGITKMLP